METQLRRSGWLTLGAVLLASLAWAQSRGTSEDESAIKALVESQNRVLVQGVGNLADVFAADADWTNAWGRRQRVWFLQGSHLPNRKPRSHPQEKAAGS